MAESLSIRKLKPFYLRSTELTSEDHVLLWGLQVVVPTKIRSSVLNLLHDTHRSCAHERPRTLQSLVARYRQGHRANLRPMSSMLATFEGSAEVSAVSLGLPLQTLATFSYRLRRPILRIDVAGVDGRLQQVRRHRESEVCRWLQHYSQVNLSFLTLRKSRTNSFRQ